MKTTIQVFLAITILLCIGVSISGAQIVSNGTGGGNWSSASTWAGGVVPTGSGTVTIRSADSVAVDIAVTITGALVDSGKVGGTGALTFGNGGTYNRAANGGRIPSATWSTGSTCLITGVTANSPSNANQNFYNVTWNCPNQTANQNVGWSGNTIGGNVTCVATGSGRFYFTSPADYSSPITINGDVVVTGGTLTTNGSSSPDTIIANTYGNVTVTAGNFGCSRGSGPSVTWNLYGNMSVSNAALQNSSTTATAVQKFVFAKAGTQTLSLTSVTYGTGTSPINMEVASGSTLNIGSSVIDSTNIGGFKLLGGGTLVSSGGKIKCAGSSAASIGNTFVTATSITGSGNLTVKAYDATHPNSPNAAKTLKRYWKITADAGITGADLKFYYLDADVQGTEANYVPMRYTGTSWVKGSAGSSVDALYNFVTGTGVANLSGDWTLGESSLVVAVESPSVSEIPQSFFVSQNYPNPFNPSTTITYGLPTESYVAAKVYNLLGQEVATLFSGRQSAGVHVLNFDAFHLNSGVYLYRVQAGTSVETKRMVLMK